MLIFFKLGFLFNFRIIEVTIISELNTNIYGFTFIIKTIRRNFTTPCRVFTPQKGLDN